MEYFSGLRLSTLWGILPLMTLAEYMKRASLDDATMAAKLGNCSAHAVKKWRYLERVPRLEQMLRIKEVTRGAVKLEDFSKPQP
jgi:hypothetical protein